VQTHQKITHLFPSLLHSSSSSDYVNLAYIRGMVCDCAGLSHAFAIRSYYEGSVAIVTYVHSELRDLPRTRNFA
jgi:hypothetical protein